MMIIEATVSKDEIVISRDELRRVLGILRLEMETLAENKTGNRLPLFLSRNNLSFSHTAQLHVAL